MTERIRGSIVLGLLLAGLAGCIGKEADPRAVEEAVGDALARDTTVAALEARVDSLEQAVSAILDRYGVQRGETAAAADDPYASSRPESAERAEPDSTPRPAPAALPAQVTYATYRNERLGYTIDYPSNVLVPAEALGQGNGQRFAAADGSAVLAVYGVDGVRPSALGALYREELEDATHRITYQTLHDDWFVLSGFAGDQVFYQRTLLRGGVLKTFLLLYDASQKAYFDPITERISFSFEG